MSKTAGCWWQKRKSQGFKMLMSDVKVSSSTLYQNILVQLPGCKCNETAIKTCSEEAWCWCPIKPYLLSYHRQTTGTAPHSFCLSPSHIYCFGLSAISFAGVILCSVWVNRTLVVRHTWRRRGRKEEEPQVWTISTHTHTFCSEFQGQLCSNKTFPVIMSLACGVP